MHQRYDITYQKGSTDRRCSWNESAERKNTNLLVPWSFSGSNQDIQFSFWTPISSGALKSRRHSEDVHDGDRTENMPLGVGKKGSSCLVWKGARFRKIREHPSVPLCLPWSPTSTNIKWPHTALRAFMTLPLHPFPPQSSALRLNCNSCIMEPTHSRMPPCFRATIPFHKVPFHLCIPSSWDNSPSSLRLRSNLFTLENIFAPSSNEGNNDPRITSLLAGELESRDSV